MKFEELGMQPYNLVGPIKVSGSSRVPYGECREIDTFRPGLEVRFSRWWTPPFQTGFELRNWVGNIQLNQDHEEFLKIQEIKF